MDKLNINNANAQDLKKRISGMGTDTANKIIEFRDKNSPIHNLEDFKNVKGVDGSTFEALKMNFHAGQEHKKEE
jgi:competence protein ComEA